jgi:hypothetical protein
VISIKLFTRLLEKNPPFEDENITKLQRYHVHRLNFDFSKNLFQRFEICIINLKDFHGFFLKVPAPRSEIRLPHSFQKNSFSSMNIMLSFPAAVVNYLTPSQVVIEKCGVIKMLMCYQTKKLCIIDKTKLILKSIKPS